MTQDTTKHMINAAIMVEMKINGQPITVDLAKVDETWLLHCLRYGVRRYVNDTHSGVTQGQDKYEACRLMVDDMISGEPMPEKAVRATGRTTDPVLALAMKNAKTVLSTTFRQVTGKTAAIDFAEHEKIAPFYTVKDGKATWNDATVQTWMKKQAEADGGVDYLAQAKATIDGAAEALKGLDLDI